MFALTEEDEHTARHFSVCAVRALGQHPEGVPTLVLTVEVARVALAFLRVWKAEKSWVSPHHSFSENGEWGFKLWRKASPAYVEGTGAPSAGGMNSGKKTH